MTASVWPSDKSGDVDPKPILPIILVLTLIMAAGALLVAVNSHALERHGEAVIGSASACFDNANSPRLNFINPTTNRNAQTCFDGDHYYIYVTEANGDPVTMFAKDKMKNIEQVVKYLCNVGYVPQSVFVCP